MDKDKMTTLAGVIAALPQILPMLGIVLIPVPILNAITGLALAVLGYYTNKK